MIAKCSNLVQGIILGYPRSDMVLRLTPKVKVTVRLGNSNYLHRVGWNFVSDLQFCVQEMLTRKSLWLFTSSGLLLIVITAVQENTSAGFAFQESATYMNFCPGVSFLSTSSTSSTSRQRSNVPSAGFNIVRVVRRRLMLSITDVFHSLLLTITGFPSKSQNVHFVKELYLYFCHFLNHTFCIFNIV